MLFSDDKLAFWTLETWFFAFGTCDLLAGHQAGRESPTENGVEQSTGHLRLRVVLTPARDWVDIAIGRYYFS
jgi:hypothetical protein